MALAAQEVWRRKITAAIPYSQALRLQVAVAVAMTLPARGTTAVLVVEHDKPTPLGLEFLDRGTMAGLGFLAELLRLEVAGVLALLE